MLRLGGRGSCAPAELTSRLTSSFKLDFLPFAELASGAPGGELAGCEAVLVDPGGVEARDRAEVVKRSLRALRAVAPAVRPVVLSDSGDAGLAREALRAGAWTVVPPEPDAVARQLRAAARLFRVQQGSSDAGAETADPFADRDDGTLLLGRSPQIRAVRRAIAQVGETDLPVLIEGESGTGKELAAISIHACSPRAGGPFVPINCGAIPPELLEAELFGCERGAFTGATHARRGQLRAAEGGTLFLDEVGELPPTLQSKLLRFLQEHTVEPVGGRRRLAVDVRVLAATNRDLGRAREEGAFREDLYHRLAVFPLQLPRLAEREGDPVLLARHFLHRYRADRREPVLGFDERALESLDAAAWPGNVRELINRVRRALVVTSGPWIGASDLGFARRGPRRVRTLRERRRQAEARCIEDALRRRGWRKRETAEALGISRTRLYELMRSYRIPESPSA